MFKNNTILNIPSKLKKILALTSNQQINMFVREYWKIFSKLKEVCLLTYLSPNQNYGKVDTEGYFLKSFDWNES